ncbi:outer membrane protein transport protein [Sabulilitoribacter arenilitoris]|uniref:Outer membrane protein transport protein n=1 Tax=Wocania arenilitoris TaxID=2044858 RepID=A0AAE3EQU1_9FLAO|nr:outer membrane protein transport protein [Wocania arenilitoris]MCF7568484.1 outer membrane protein transport protein [Wocania arenilitoris]
MKINLISYLFLLFNTAIFSQAGHIMQGVGATNMSMGGASTSQPLDISGALHWNPASTSVFNNKIIKLDVGLFFSSPELSSSIGSLSGTTKDDRGASPMPALAIVWGKAESKHTFGVSAFGISGFGVTFPEDSNYPQDMIGTPNPNYNSAQSSNPVNFPQTAGGFGHIESDYILLQIGLSYAYEVTNKLSIGIQPNIDYATLELIPNPTANPSQTAGYPSTNKASAIGFGTQFGLFYDTGVGLKMGTSYKTTQKFNDFKFDNTYLDNSKNNSEFQMDYPAIFSLGLGYSTDVFDFAFDFRRVDYENTDGFSKTGWTHTGAVSGFGWKNISIISTGFQYKGINKLPLRVGYTYSSNPIPEEVVFFNVPATAIIKNACQFGLSYAVNSTWKVDAVYHYGDSNGKTEGKILSPFMSSQNNPLGAFPKSSVTYNMTTSMLQFGISYTFTKKK